MARGDCCLVLEYAMRPSVAKRRAHERRLANFLRFQQIYKEQLNDSLRIREWWAALPNGWAAMKPELLPKR